MRINAVSEGNFTLNRIHEKPQEEKSEFGKIFSNLLNSATQADAEDKAQNLSLIAGEAEDPHNVLIAAEKADLSLLLAVEVRNKIIDAYNEIMRMQI